MENNRINNVVERIKAKRKQNINITLDIKLVKALEEYKKKHDIKSLSPMINEMLWNFIEDDRGYLEEELELQKKIFAKRRELNKK